MSRLPTSGGPTAGEQLLAIGREARLFHAPDGSAHATVPVGDHQETWALRSSGFKSWSRWHELVAGADDVGRAQPIHGPHLASATPFRRFLRRLCAGRDPEARDDGTRRVGRENR